MSRWSLRSIRRRDDLRGRGRLLKRPRAEDRTKQEALAAENRVLRDQLRRLERSRGSLRSFYADGRIGYFTLGRAGTVVEANARALEVLGLVGAPVEGRALVACFSEEHAGAFGQYLSGL